MREEEIPGMGGEGLLSSMPEVLRKVLTKGIGKMAGTLLKELSHREISAHLTVMTCGLSLSNHFLGGNGDSSRYQVLDSEYLMRCFSAHSWLKRFTITTLDWADCRSMISML